jgi:hypothetical protein
MLSPPPDSLRRRALLQAAGWAWLGLPGCGGGGGGSTDAGGGNPTPPAGNPPASPPGTLVYRNGSEAAARNLTTGQQVVFDPGSNPLVDPGLAITPERTVLTALQDDNEALYIGRYTLGGQYLDTLRIPRELPLLSSTFAFNAAGDRVAFSLSEIPPGGSDRVDRTLVFTWPAGLFITAFDGWECPVWAGNHLLLRHVENQQLHWLNAQLQPQGWLAGIVLRTWVDAYTASPDGRYVVWADGPDLRAFDRTTGQAWVAAHRTSDVNSPCFSPDGRWLAVRAIDQTSATDTFWVRTLHIVPFVPGVTSDVDSALYAQRDSLVEIGGRMAWVA